jgi:hypothetical protein
MRKILILLFSAIVVSVVLVASASATQSVTPTLTGTDGPGSRSTEAGAPGREDPESRHLQVRDPRQVLDPRLVARRAARICEDISAVPFTGTKTVTLKLKAGATSSTARRTSQRCSATSPSSNDDTDAREAAAHPAAASAKSIEPVRHLRRM